MKQLETYRSVAKNAATPGEKSPKRPTGGKGSSVPSSAGGGGAAGGTAADKTGGSSAAASGGGAQQPARKKTRASAAAAAAASATTNVSNSQLGDLARIMKQGFSRLENLATLQMPPKLPSPLHEMHRIRSQLQQRDDTDLLAFLEPYYSEAVGNHLAQVTSQANNSAHPAMLPTVLEGLDTLLQGSHDTQLESSIQYTYKIVFKTYLKLSNPNVTAAAGNAEPQSSGGSSRKRKAKQQDVVDDGKTKKSEDNAAPDEDEETTAI